MSTSFVYATCPACGKECATWNSYEIHLALRPACRAVADANAAVRAEAGRERETAPKAG